MNYRQIINAIALSQVTQKAQVAGLNLGIGLAERLESVPVLLFTDYSRPQQPAKYSLTAHRKHEEVQPNLRGAKVSREDFPTGEFYVGNPTEGV